MRGILFHLVPITMAIAGLTAGWFGGSLRAAGGAKDPLGCPEVQKLLASYRREATLLQPRRAEKPLGFARSKMGGVPNLNGFTAWPRCDACKNELNFVLQLYKSDFPGFYFPPVRNLFQLFRCPNLDCPAAYSDKWDLKMFHYYFTVSTAQNKAIKIPAAKRKDMEAKVPDCYFAPVTIQDYPNYDEYPERDWQPVEKKLGEKGVEAFFERYSARTGTKYGGYPSWTQYANYPKCTCGRMKEFFFQLSSEEPKVEGAVSSNDEWSPHGIMIGDVGNIYFFVCPKCGEKSIETNWDCY